MTRRPPPSPWLSIPAADYEGHMASPEVGQLQFLGEVFREALLTCRPRTVAVLGCATGNGFKHFAAAGVGRVVAVDVNPAYLEVIRARHAGSLPGLELLCADIAACDLEPDAFDLVSCALLLEYVEPAAVVARVSRWLAPTGVLSTVLQLPSPGHGTVSETPFASLKRLERVMRLVDPQHLTALAQGFGLSLSASRIATLDSGKRFFVAEYRKPPAP